MGGSQPDKRSLELTNTQGQNIEFELDGEEIELKY
jgi:hypothetical protein